MHGGGVLHPAGRHGVFHIVRVTETACSSRFATICGMVAGKCIDVCLPNRASCHGRGWPAVIGTLRLEERERLWKFRSMIERAKYFADVEVIKITHEDEEKLAVLLLQVRFCSKLKSAHFKCEKDLTMIMERPVQFFFPQGGVW